jgi:hypothetical protein
MTTDPAGQVVLALDGRVRQYGDVKIKGELRPFDPKARTELTMVFNNIEMTDLSPYTAKFAGRKIESGKLSMDLRYRINQSRLQGDNQIIMDSLLLGEPVESATAMDLPLDLALALMRDADDRIDIGLPVSGNLENPQFSYSHLIWKALANVLTKIVSAPFRALGAVLGVDGDELDAVGFEPGRAVLPPPEAEKLVTLSQALVKRPQLVLVIRGAYDGRRDATALKDRTLRSDILEMTGAVLPAEQDPGPLSFSDPAVRQAIAALAAQRLTPRQMLDFELEADDPAVEATDRPTARSGEAAPLAKGYYQAVYRNLRKAVQLESDALSRLASERARAIRAVLVQQGGLDDARLQVGEPLPVEGQEQPAVHSPLELTARP